MQPDPTESLGPRPYPTRERWEILKRSSLPGWESLNTGLWPNDLDTENEECVVWYTFDGGRWLKHTHHEVNGSFLDVVSCQHCTKELTDEELGCIPCCEPCYWPVCSVCHIQNRGSCPKK